MNRSNLILSTVSLFTCVLGAEFFLRIAKLGYNNAPQNPSNVSHHEHPKNFSFTAYSPVGEWDNIVINILNSKITVHFHPLKTDILETIPIISI